MIKGILKNFLYLVFLTFCTDLFADCGSNPEQIKLDSEKVKSQFKIKSWYNDGLRMRVVEVTAPLKVKEGGLINSYISNIENADVASSRFLIYLQQDVGDGKVIFKFFLTEGLFEKTNIYFTYDRCVSYSYLLSGLNDN